MTGRKIEKIWTKDFIGVFVTQFLVFIAFYALLTTLPIYVIDRIGGTNSDAGLVVTVMLFSAILIRPFSSKLLEFTGKKQGLVVAAIAFTGTSFLYILIDAFIPLLILRFIHGISFGFITTVTGAIAADVIPPNRRGAGLGYFAMSTNLALVIGPFVGLSLLQITTFQNLFIVLSFLLLISVVSSIMVQVPRHAEFTKKVTSFKLKMSDLIETKALPVALISGLVGMSYGSILSFISVYANSIGLATFASYFFIIFAIVMLASRPSVGRAFDNRGAKFVLLPSLFLFSVGLFALGFTTHVAMFFIAAGLIGLGYGSLLPGFQTLAIQSTGRKRSSHATATFFIFYDLGIGIGSFTWGLVATNFGFANMYKISAILVLVTLLIYHQYTIWKKKSVGMKQKEMDVKVQ